MSQAQAKEEVKVDLALIVPTLLTHKDQTAYLRVGLTGFPLQTKEEPLVPVNMVLVIDLSNSMFGAS